MSKRFLSVFLSVCLLLTLAPAGVVPQTQAADEGTGLSRLKTAVASGLTANASFQIADAEDLKALSTLSQTRDFSGVSLYITADIEYNAPECFTYNSQTGLIGGLANGMRERDVDGEWVYHYNTWTPAGEGVVDGFKGSIYGQRHTISGIYCVGSKGMAGLIGWHRSGKIQELTLDNCYFSCEANGQGVTPSVGAFCASSDCLVDGCTVTRTRIFAGASGDGGGIAGTLGGTIHNCVSYANVFGRNVGGVAGKCSGTIRSCYSEGKLVATYGDVSSVGGIVGTSSSINGSYCTITNCGSTASLEGWSDSYGYVAGIIGSLYSTTSPSVANCWFAGSMECGTSRAAIASVYSHDNSTSSSDAFWKVKNCYAASGVFPPGGTRYLLNRTTAPAFSTVKQETDTDTGGLGVFQTEMNEVGKLCQTVYTTTQNGYRSFWQSTGTGTSEYLPAADSEFAVSGQTDLVDALNAWCARNCDVNPTSGRVIYTSNSIYYLPWTRGANGMPELCRDDSVWSDAADPDYNADYINSQTTIDISTPEQLAALGKSGNNFSGKTLRLTRDIDLSGRRWDMSAEFKNFTGVFDGQGYTIYGLYLCTLESNGHALFNRVEEGGVIRNLNVRGIARSNAVAGVAHRINGIVDNCSFEGYLYGTTGLGGIAGEVFRNDSETTRDGSITNCWTGGTFHVLMNGSAGGIACSNRGLITNCYSMARVTVKKINATDTSTYAGGIAAYNQPTGQNINLGTIDNCYHGGPDSPGIVAGSRPAQNSYYLSGGKILGVNGAELTGDGTRTAEEVLRDTLNARAKVLAEASAEGAGPNAVYAKAVYAAPAGGVLLDGEDNASSTGYTDWTQSVCANESLPYYASFAGGDGSAGDPIVITSLEHLAYLAATVNAGESYSGKHFTLATDLAVNSGSFGETGSWYDVNGNEVHESVNPESWISVGTAEHPFDGVFDGKGHTIYGLYGTAGGSLFGALDANAVVRNVFIDRSWLGGGASALAGSAAVGAQIVNCGSAAYGAGGRLTLAACVNCDDRSTGNTAASLNEYTGIGSTYSTWYESPAGYPLFTATYVPITYSIGKSASMTSAPASFVYGTALPAIPDPTDAGNTFVSWTVTLTTDAGSTTTEWVRNTSALDISGALAVELGAVWTKPLPEGETFWTAYCTLGNDGVYVLKDDVTLAEPVCVTDRKLLDFNGHTLSGYADSALVQIRGGTLILMNRNGEYGAAGQIKSNAAAVKGYSGALLCVESFVNTDRPNTVVSSFDPAALNGGGTAIVYQTALNSVTAGSDYRTFFATYESDGKMSAIEQLSGEQLTANSVSSDPTYSVSYRQELTLEQLKTVSTKLFVIPDSWLTSN